MGSLSYVTFLFTLLYAAIATAFHYITHWTVLRRMAGFEFAWLLPLSILTLGVFFFERKEIKKHFQSGNLLKKNWDFILLVVGVLCLRLFNINVISIWGDEDAQAMTSYYNFPIRAGGEMHQPPLDLVLVNFAIKIFGYKAWALRIHSALFSSLAAGFLYLASKQISKSKLVAATCALLFAMHKYSIQYGYEARPISSGLFFEIIFVYLIYSLLSDGESIFKKKYWTLAACTFLFLNSLGLQPAFIVGGTLSFLIIYSIFNRAYLQYGLAVLAGLLAFLPIQAAIISIAPPRFTKTSGLNPALFFSEFKAENFDFLTLYFEPFGYIILFFIAANVLISAIKQVRPMSAASVYLIFCLIFFIGVLIPFFRSHVSYFLQVYYVVLCLPLVFLIFADQWVRFSKLALFDFRVLKFISVGCVVASALYYFEYGRLLIEKSDHPNHADQEGAFSLIKERSPELEKNVILSLCIHDIAVPGADCTSSYVGKAFYYAPPGVNGSPWEEPLFEYHEALVKGDVENIFVLFYSNESQMSLRANHFIGEVLGLEVYHLKTAPSTRSIAENVINFMEPVIQKGIKRKILYTRFLEYVVKSYEILEDKNNRLRYVNLYKNFQGFKARSNYLEDLVLAND